MVLETSLQPFSIIFLCYFDFYAAHFIISKNRITKITQLYLKRIHQFPVPQLILSRISEVFVSKNSLEKKKCLN